MLSNGETAVATTTDAAVKLIDNTNGKAFRSLRIINGANAGFYSLDNSVWARLPANATVELYDLHSAGHVWVKRPAGGTDLADVWGSAW